MYDDDSLLADARRNTDEVDVVPVRNVRQHYVCSYGLVPKDSTTYLHPRLVAVDLDHLKEDDTELKKQFCIYNLFTLSLDQVLVEINQLHTHPSLRIRRKIFHRHHISSGSFFEGISPL